MELGTLAFIHRETGTGNLVAKLEIDDVVLGSQFPMRQRVLGQMVNLAYLLLDHVLRSVLAFRHRFMRHVRNTVEQSLDFLFQVRYLARKFLVPVLVPGGLFFQGIGLLLLALLEKQADFLGHLIDFLLDAFQFLLSRTLLGIQVYQFTDILFGGSIMLLLQRLDYLLGIFPDYLQLQHLVLFLGRFNTGSAMKDSSLYFLTNPSHFNKAARTRGLPPLASPNKARNYKIFNEHHIFRSERNLFSRKVKK